MARKMMRHERGTLQGFHHSDEAAEAYRRLKAEQRRAHPSEQWTYGERLRVLKAAYDVLREEEALFGL